jgi:hypothetical protein
MLSATRAQRELNIAFMISYAVIESPVMFALLPPSGTILSWLVYICGTLAAGAATFALQRAISAALAQTISRATGVSGGAGATASYFSMSGVQSLIVRERWDEAVAQLQAASRMHRGETGAIIAQQLADLLSFRLRQHEDAVRSYRKARDLWTSVDGVRAREGVAYCTRRLVDLYTDALDNPTAAEREASRLRA